MRRLLLLAGLLALAAPARAQQGVFCDSSVLFSCGGIFGLMSDGTYLTSTLPLTLPSGSVSDVSLRWNVDATTSGWYRSGADAWTYTAASSPRVRIGGSSLSLASSSTFNFASADATTAADLTIARDAADIWAQRRGANAQEARVYKSDSGADDSFWTTDNKTSTAVVYYGMALTGAGVRSLPVGIGSMSRALTESAATNIFSITLGASAVVGGTISYTVVASDATPDFQARTGIVTFSILNKAATETCVISGPAGNANPTQLQDGSTLAASLGTLTYAWAVDTTGANLCTFTLNPVSSLTQTSFTIRYRVELNETLGTGQFSQVIPN